MGLSFASPLVVRLLVRKRSLLDFDQKIKMTDNVLAEASKERQSEIENSKRKRANEKAAEQEVASKRPREDGRQCEPSTEQAEGKYLYPRITKRHPISCAKLLFNSVPTILSRKINMCDHNLFRSSR